MAEVRDIEIDANGLRFEALVAGPEDGEAVILLHGYPQSGLSWEPTVGWLANHGYRAIAPSLRGYSPGANPQEASAYTMPQLVADVVGIADASGVAKFHLVGHDWGGALAWAVAIREPERLLSLTSLSTPHPAAMVEAIRTSTQMLRSSYMGFFKLPRVPEAVLSFANFAQLGLSTRMSGLPKDAWRRDREQLQRVGLRGPLNWYRAATGQPRKQRRITTPTMFVWGRRDLFLGRTAAELTAKHVRGPYRFEELDAGHWIPERNAAQLHELLATHLHANHGAEGHAARHRAGDSGGRAKRATKAAAKPAAKRPARPRRRKGSAESS